MCDESGANTIVVKTLVFTKDLTIAWFVPFLGEFWLFAELWMTYRHDIHNDYSW